MLRPFTLIALLLFVCHALADGVPAAGAGTADDPYQIATLDNLLWLSTSDSVWACHFVQTADIDASDTQNWNNSAGVSPIGVSEQLPFEGMYNGQGYSIDGLYVNRPDAECQGLFGYITDAEIVDVHVLNACITGNDCVGAVSGRASEAVITNCSSSGTLAGEFHLGGVLGYADDVTITGCSSAVNVTVLPAGGYCTGGLIGNAQNTTVLNCFSLGVVSCGGYAGGLIGWSCNTIIDCCFSTGEVDESHTAGGLVGLLQYSELTRSWSTGEVICSNYDSVGGLIGQVIDSQLANCYSEGSVTGQSGAGGLVGVYENLEVNNCHYDYTNVLVNGESKYGLGVMRSDMYQDWRANHLSLDIDDYLTFTSGCVRIHDFDDLFAMLAFCQSGQYSFILTDDITLRYHPGFYVPCFSGEFNGGNHTIEDFYMNLGNEESQNVGFFGYSHEAVYSNLTLANVSVTGKAYVGGMIGFAQEGTTLDNCHVTGRVVTEDFAAGGLLSCCEDSLFITDCSFIGVVEANDVMHYAGGLLYMNYGPTTIENSFTQGIVNGGGGGFAFLLQNSVITNCYSTVVVNGPGAGFVYRLAGSTVTDCFSTGDIPGGNDRSGGFAVYISDNSILSNCHSTGNVTGIRETGGFAAQIGHSTLDCCFSEGEVSGHYGAGGFVGDCDLSQITSCHSTGDVTGDITIGGFVGISLGSQINLCFCTGNVTGELQVGGFVGKNVWDGSNIENCYARGDVMNGGGFVGNNTRNATIANCYCAGSVINGMGFANENTDGAVIANCFWDTQVSGMPNSAGGTGATTAEMQSLTLYTNAGWDFIGETANGEDDCWGLNPDENDGYPFLAWQGYTHDPPGTVPQGAGAEDDPYIVFSLGHLEWLSLNPGSWDAHILQTADIEAIDTQNWNNGAGFSPIGNDDLPFTGVYHAQNHTISNLFIDRPDDDCVGLFGVLENAWVDSLMLSNIAVYGDSCVGGLAGWGNEIILQECNFSGEVNATNKIGGLAGELHSSIVTDCSTNGIVHAGGFCAGGLIGKNELTEISNCGALGVVTGSWYVGGLTGLHSSSSTISRCFSECGVTGDGQVGGLVGSANFASVDNSYCQAVVTGDEIVGGLIGKVQNTTVTNCYSASSVDGETMVGGFVGHNGFTIHDSFWDSEVAGVANAAGSGSTSGMTGLSTDEMNRYETFDDARWDFLEESANGDEDIWGINPNENAGYPFLAWQGYEHDPNVGVGEETPAPTFALDCYPNPFNPTTTIRFSIPQSCHVELIVYNIRGQLVRTLVNEPLEAGQHKVVWGAEGHASGVYFVRVVSSGDVLTRRMLLLK